MDGSFEMVRPSLELLGGYGAEIRYPGDFSSKQEARDAVKAMRQVREFVRGKLPVK